MSAALLDGSQRRETPFSSSDAATEGKTVFSAASSTRRVSVLLHAAGYEVFESTTTLMAMAGSAVCSR